MFPNSPLYTAGETEATVRANAKTYLQPTLQSGDPDQFPGGVNLDYQGPVDSSGVVVSATAAPTFGTLTSGQYEGRYYPFLVVPTDPAAEVDGTSTGVERLANDNFGSGNSITSVFPESTSAKIAETTIEATGPIAPRGQSGANLPDGSTKTTHIDNPGALT